MSNEGGFALGGFDWRSMGGVRIMGISIELVAGSFCDEIDTKGGGRTLL